MQEFNEPQIRRDARGIEQVWVKPGCFVQGSNRWWDWLAEEDEAPAHEVCFSKGFWIDRYEVSNAAFDTFVAAGGYSEKQFWLEEGWRWKGNRQGPDPTPEPGFQSLDQPRMWTTWYEAAAYASWRYARLPAEAEWEYAARGPGSWVYPWGDRWDLSKANVTESRHSPAEGKILRTATVSVTSYQSGISWCGALHMSGNVWEWTADWYDAKYYRLRMRLDPQGPRSGMTRVMKGGSHGSSGELGVVPPGSARAARRSDDVPEFRSHALGFRVVSDGETRSQ
jgi:iron(II)-dependent oxidoreductase